MATRASRNKRLIETRQSPIPFTGPLTPSPQSGTQVKTPEVQGLFNAPANVEAQNTYKAMGNLGNTLSQTGQALQQRKIKARQLNTIDNRIHDFLLKAEEMDKRLHRMMVTRVFDPSRGEIGPERQRPKFQLDPSEYETQYKKGLKLLKEQAVEGLLDKDGTPIDPVVHRGISDSVNTYLRDKIPEMLSFATKMEIGKIEGDWERNIRDAMQAAQDGVLNIKAADTYLAKAYERGLELARTGAFPKGESEVRGRIAALAKEWMTSEVLDARSVEQLEGILKSQQYRWMPREVIESRIKTLKQEERAVNEAQRKAYNFNNQQMEKKQGVLKGYIKRGLFQEAVNGAAVSNDPKVVAAWTANMMWAMGEEIVSYNDYIIWKDPEKVTPLGLEETIEIQKMQKSLHSRMVQKNEDLANLEENINTARTLIAKTDNPDQKNELRKKIEQLEKQEGELIKGIGSAALALAKDLNKGRVRYFSSAVKRLEGHGLSPNDSKSVLKDTISGFTGPSITSGAIQEYNGLLEAQREAQELGEKIYGPDIKPTPVEKQGMVDSDAERVAVKGQQIKPTPINEGMGSELFGPKDTTPEQLKELEDINEYMKREGTTKEKPKTKEVYDPEHDVTFIEDETEKLRPSEEPITITFDELLKSKDYKDNVNWDDPNDINRMAQIMKQEINEGRIVDYNVTNIPKDIDKAYPIKGKKKKKMSKAEDRLRTFLTKNQDALNQLFDGNKQLESKVNELLNRGLWSEVLKLLKQELDDNTSYTFED